MIPSTIYEWFLEPLDSQTNRAIARELSEENCIREMAGPEGRKLNLWRCSFSFIRSFARSRADLDLSFKVYNRRGGGGLREYPFAFKEGSNRPKAEKTLQDFQQKQKNHR